MACDIQKRNKLADSVRTQQQHGIAGEGVESLDETLSALDCFIRECQQLNVQNLNWD